jgi:hypothetical protein
MDPCALVDVEDRRKFGSTEREETVRRPNGMTSVSLIGIRCPPNLERLHVFVPWDDIVYPRAHEANLRVCYSSQLKCTPTALVHVQRPTRASVSNAAGGSIAHTNYNQSASRSGSQTYANQPEVDISNAFQRPSRTPL